MAEPYVSLRVDYPRELLAKALFKEDMEYLRQRILTDRSERNDVSAYVSRYYEAAKTIVDMLEYTSPEHKMALRDVYLVIDPDEKDGITKLVSNWTTGKLSIGLCIEYSYRSSAYQGAESTYSIDVRTTGLVSVERQLLRQTSKDPLKYSWNFPSPSVYSALLEAELQSMFKELPGEDNEDYEAKEVE